MQVFNLRACRTVEYVISNTIFCFPGQIAAAVHRVYF